MFTYSSVKELSYASVDNVAINMVVQFDHMDAPVHFIARGDDVELHGIELYHKAVNGDFGPVAEYSAPIVPTLTLMQKQASLKTGITIALDVKAQELKFDSFAEALTYVDESTVPLYQQQALALRAWRSLCWKRFDEIVASAQDFDVVMTIEDLPTFSM